MQGVLNVDKPEDLTSHDVVNQIRDLTGQQRVGHGGTLDPFATGVLLVAVGSATRLFEYTRDLRKTYQATFMLGATSDTDDKTGKITKIENTKSKQITKQKITKVLDRFTGDIGQVPPAYSAVKQGGKKLYEMARAGQPVVAKARQVTIYAIKIARYNYPELELAITCSGGTYIRALARDLGQKLGVGGYVQELRRTAIGNFTAEDSVPLDTLIEEPVAEHLLPPEALVAHLPHVQLTATQVDGFTQGKLVTPPGNLGLVAVFDTTESLLGIGQQTEAGLQPEKVIRA